MSPRIRRRAPSASVFLRCLPQLCVLLALPALAGRAQAPEPGQEELREPAAEPVAEPVAEPAVEPTREASAGSPLSATAEAADATDADEQGLADVVGRGDSMPPARARFEIHLGWRFMQQGLASQAALSFERVTKDSPWHPGAWYLLSRARHAEERIGDALAAAESAVAAYAAMSPARSVAFEPSQFQHQLGICLNAAGRPAEGALALQEALRLRPGASRLLGELGDTLLKLGRDAEAASVLRQAVDAEPTLAIAQLAYGRALSRLDRHAEAQAAIERSIELAPDSADAWYSLASVFRATADFEAQERALARFEELREPREAERLARQEIDARLRSAARGMLEGDCVGARPVLDEVLAHPFVQRTGFRRGRILNDLARCEVLGGDEAAALRLYRQALALNPRSFTANFELGTLLASRGRVEAALPLLLDASAINPFDYSVHANLALAHALLGRLNDAVGEVRRAAALQPEDLRVRQLLVDFEWAVGNEPQAQAIVTRLGGVELPGEGKALGQGAEWAR